MLPERRDWPHVLDQESEWLQTSPQEHQRSMHRLQNSKENLFLTSKSIFKLSVKCEGRMKTFSDFQSLRFTPSVPFVKKVLKYILHQYKKM